MPKSNPRPDNPGAANASPWEVSGFGYAPNTNVMDPNTMPSDTAAAARVKANQIMAALNSGNTAEANALLGKNETPGGLLPGMRWLKKKRNSKSVPKLEGQDGAGPGHMGAQSEEIFIGKEDKKDKKKKDDDEVIR